MFSSLLGWEKKGVRRVFDIGKKLFCNNSSIAEPFMKNVIRNGLSWSLDIVVVDGAIGCVCCIVLNSQQKFFIIPSGNIKSDFFLFVCLFASYCLEKMNLNGISSMILFSIHTLAKKNADEIY